MIRLSADEVEALGPCDISWARGLFGKNKRMNAAEAFAAGASIRDLCWVAGKLKEKKKLAIFARKCAESVAHIKNSHAAAAYAADAAAYAAAYAAAAAADAADYAADAAAAAAADAYAVWSKAKEAQIEKNKQFFIEVFDGEDV